MMNGTTRLTGMVVLILVGLLLVGAQSANARAEEGESRVSDEGESRTPPTEPEAEKKLRVSKVEGALRLGSTITVTVDGLEKYLKATGNDPEKFILYLNCKPHRDLQAVCAPQGGNLIFQIKKTSSSNGQWRNLLGRPFSRDKGFTYPIAVSIGYEDEQPLPSDVTDYPLVIVHKARFWFFVALFLIVLVLFGWLTRNSGIIRDSYPGLPGRLRTYSLARTQMAFWFFIVVASYVFLWVTTTEQQSLGNSTLVLIGISAATGLSATAVSSSKRSAAASKLDDLQEEKKVMETRLAQLAELMKNPPVTPETDKLLKEQAEKEGALSRAEKAIPAVEVELEPEKTKGFFSDILSDAGGISLHRFQIAVWTVILGVIFLHSTWDSLTMPEFDSTFPLCQ